MVSLINFKLKHALNKQQVRTFLKENLLNQDPISIQ